jgi:hypothetical protein
MIKPHRTIAWPRGDLAPILAKAWMQSCTQAMARKATARYMRCSKITSRRGIILDVGARVIKKAMIPKESKRNLLWAKNARMTKSRRNRKEVSVCNDNKLVASG